MKTVEREAEMDGRAIRSLRERELGVSQERFARLVGVTLGTVSRWERDEVHPDRATAEKILRLRRIAAALSAVMDPERALAWLETPNERFAGNPPLDLLASRFATTYLERFVDEGLSGTPLLPA